MKILKRRGGDYSYAFGVVSAKTLKIFSRKQLEDIAMYKSVGEITAFLEGTEYEQDIHGAVGKVVDPGKLEKSILKHFTRIFKEIVSTIPEADRETLKELILGNIEAENIEVMIRMIKNRAKPEDIENYLTPCTCDDKYMSEAISSKDIKELIENMKESDFYNALKLSYNKYEETNSTVPLETAVEKELAEKWLALEEKISEDLKIYIGTQIDAMNIRALVRVIISEDGRSGIFIEGGKYVTKDMFDRPVVVSDVAEMLKNTPYAQAVNEGIENYEKTKSLVHLENILYRENVNLFVDKSLLNPLGMGSIILFISRKKIEIKNLRRIIICKANGVPSDEIKELLL